MNLDFFTIDTGTILFTLINTLLIFLAFRFILFKRVDAILEKRQKEVDSVYDAADEALADANSKKEQYTAAMTNAKEEAAGIVARAEKTAQREGDAIVAQAKQEAAAAREKASLETAREKAQARAELQGEISGLAMDLAQKIMEKEISQKDHARLIDEFLEEMDSEGDSK